MIAIYDRELFLAWRAAAAKPPVTRRVSVAICAGVLPGGLATFFESAKLAGRVAGSPPSAYALVASAVTTGATVVAQRAGAPATVPPNYALLQSNADLSVAAAAPPRFIGTFAAERYRYTDRRDSA